MFAFVLGLVPTSPSFKYKFIKSMILKNRFILYFKNLWRYQDPFGRYCVACVLSPRKGLAFLYNNGPRRVFYIWGSLSFANAGSTCMTALFNKCGGLVHKTSLALPHVIEVSVPTQNRMSDHVFAYCAHRFCLHFYLFLAEFWNCPDGVAVISFS